MIARMKHLKYMLILMVLSILITLCVSYSFKDNLKFFSTEDYSFKYDKTWKLKKDEKKTELIHKKTNSILNIQSKIIEKNYIDISLNNLISDISRSIEEQNPEYRLINRTSNNDRYESFSYLYEAKEEQVLVNIYKENNKIVIIYYSAPSEYFDIVLDSVDTILDNLEIKSGEKISDF